MSDGSTGLSLLKVGAILFALGVVSYFVISGHKRANPEPVKVQVKFKNSPTTADTTPSREKRSQPAVDGQPEPMPADDRDERPVGPPEDVFIYSSKAGVMYVGPHGEKYQAGQMKLGTEADGGIPDPRKQPRSRKAKAPPALGDVFIHSSKTGILELVDPFEEPTKPDAGLDAAVE
jgi:hypothetical protein